MIYFIGAKGACRLEKKTSWNLKTPVKKTLANLIGDKKVHS